MPIKAIVSGAEKDVKRIPMKGRNLAYGRIETTNITANGTIVRTSGYDAAIARVENGVVYTVNSHVFAFYTDEPAIGSVSYNDSRTVATAGHSTTFTAPITGYVAFRIAPSEPAMLNLGSTAMPYEPYGYQEGWEVRDNQNRLIWGREETLTGTSSISFKGAGVPLKSVDILGNTQQTGTPTPDAPIMPDFCGKLVGADWTIPISCAGQTTPVYLGEVPTVRRVKKLVLTKNYTWHKRNDSNVFYTFLTSPKAYTECLCSHYLAINTEINPPAMQTGQCTCKAGAGTVVFIKDDNYTTVDDFKAYIHQQYVAGTPVTVWYVLATPTTGIANEPLAKIGDYADELHNTIPIPTVKGQNLLTVDTTLPPSNTSITGHITSAS